MKKVIALIIFFNFAHLYSRELPVSCPESKFKTVTSWVQACKKMPKNRDTKIVVDCTRHSPFFEKAESFLDNLKNICELQNVHEAASQEYVYILDLWKNMVAAVSLSKDNLWALSNTGKQKPNKSFYDTQKLLKQEEFQPYVQKLLAKSDDQFYVHGDLHGDMHSLIIELEYLLKEGIIDENFRITSDNVWFLFLGDYVDRGKYGSEVIYTLLRLSLANPDRVILVRGNHEDIDLTNIYGFKDEVMQKFKDENVYCSIARIYDFLPVALYLGIDNKNENIINYIQCCHGGLEVGYDPKSFLDDITTSYQLVGNLYCPELLKKCDEFLQKAIPSKLKKGIYQDHYKHKGFQQIYIPNDPGRIGFLWNDFNVSDTALVLFIRGFEYGSLATQSILDVQSSEHSKIRGVIRAHQHSDEMMPHIIKNKGVFKMWREDEESLTRVFKDGLVWTFNVGPDSVYGDYHKYDFHTFAKITLQKNYDDWTMQVFNLTV